MTTLTILSTKVQAGVVVHKVAVLGGSLKRGDGVRIPQGGGNPSIGTVTKLMNGNIPVNAVQEDTIANVVIHIGEHIWNPARKPPLVVIPAPAPEPKLCR